MTFLPIFFLGQTFKGTNKCSERYTRYHFTDTTNWNRTL